MLGTMTTMEKRIESLAELKEEARRFVSTLPKAKGRATLVTLSGELGAGKTAFTQAVGEALSVKERMTSPTFALLKTYPLPPPARWKHLVHIDAYRLKGGGELAPLLFNELQSDPDTLLLVEWPERVREALPRPDVAITLVVDTPSHRRVIYD